MDGHRILNQMKTKKNTKKVQLGDQKVPKKTQYTKANKYNKKNKQGLL